MPWDVKAVLFAWSRLLAEKKKPEDLQIRKGGKKPNRYELARRDEEVLQEMSL